MRKRVIAGFLAVVMVVSTLQIQTVSVLAMEQQAEENGSFMEEDAETGEVTQEEVSAAEEAESEAGTRGEEFGVEEKEAEPETKKKESGVEEKEAEPGATKEESAVEEKETESGAQEEVTDAEDIEVDSEARKEDVEDTESEAEMSKEEEADAGEEETVENVEEAGQESEGKVAKAGIASGTYKENGSDVSWVIDESGKLTVEGRGEFAASGRSIASPKIPWYSYRESIVSAEIKVTGMTDASCMFFACSNLKSVDLGGFDTSKVTNMSNMFTFCDSLTELDLRSFHTDNVTDMSGMFFSCDNLTKLDVSSFHTDNVTNMSEMFSSCTSLMKLDVSGFDTGSVTDMSAMFGACWNLTSLDVRNFRTGNVTNMSGMFGGCKSLKSLDLSGFDTGNVTNMSNMFGCDSLTSLNLSSFDTGKVTDMSGMFSGCKNLKSLDLSGFDTSNVTTMNTMFWGCSGLTSLTVSSFETSKVTDMSYMFWICSSISSLDVSSFDTGNVTRMDTMFSGCSGLTSLDLSSFDVGKVDNMDNIFNDCKSLELIYTPRNVQVEALLPYDEDSDAWYDYEGNSVTELPKNLSYSIVLTKNNKTPVLTISATKAKTLYETGETLNVDDVKVRCCDDRGIVVNVTEGFTTNAADIDMSTPGKKILKVTYNNMTTEVEIEVVAVVFFTVTFTGTGKDDIAEGTPVRAKKDADYLFTLVKAAGYTYTVTTTMGENSVTLSVDESGNTYTIPNVTADLVITIEKTVDQSTEPEPGPEEKTYTVTFTGTGKDDIAEGTSKEVKEGTDYTFTLVKATGYTYIVTAAMGENSVTPAADETGNTYTIRGVNDNLVITIEKTAGQSPEPEPEPEPEDTTGLQIKFVNENDKKSIYTGMVVQPEIKVTYNGKRLTAGVDYTVKYSNNTKVGTAKITITGKGNFSQANSQTAFDIVPKDISDGDVTLSGATADGNESLIFANAAKLMPVLYYNNIKLTSKDFVVKDANGSEIMNKKLSAGDNGSTVKIEGKSGGNFTGSREVTLKVVDKSELVKFTVAVDKTKVGALIYNGSAQYIHDISGALTVTAKNTAKTQMQYGTDYTIVYPKDVTSAGTKKFTVVGMGLYTGSVSKSYTVKPAKETALQVFYDGTDVTGNKIRNPFQFASAGITFNSRLAVKGSGDNLIEGKDYKVSYSGNKKVNQNAKCTINFLGNYKGHAKVTVSFEIVKADLGKTDVIIADQLYKSKAGIYKSVPYVVEDKDGSNSLLSSSNYKVTYYIQDPTNNGGALQMKGKNKAGDGDTVWVKLEAKGKNYSGEKIVSYKVRQAQDLSKARITFQDAGGRDVKSTAYTGSKITSSQIKAVVNGTLVENDSDIEVVYVNNINKGKATVIVKAAGRDGCKYTGCKKETFSIVARGLN